ncbi:hypothetical protein AGMMS49975_28020 [Clostridia bacterium]|nr:hypothetical protein AGMMS49975_28020 [Clostridia bacterium]
METFYLMNGNDKIMEFGYELILLGNEYDIYDVFMPESLPIDLRMSDDLIFRLNDWVERRTIPVNRHHMEAVLSALNLENRFDILLYCHGLSLNDTFWVQAEYEDLDFDKINFYDNPFDETI